MTQTKSSYINSKNITKLLKSFLNIVGISITSRKNLDRLNGIAIEYESLENDFGLIQDLSSYGWPRLISLIKESKSQIRQDLFVLSILDFKTQGFFVEFGAADGIQFSNTHLLAKRFGWKGILAEPAVVWQKALTKNRPESIVTDLCIWSESGVKLQFSESDTPELSTVTSHMADDFHAESRKSKKNYLVESVTLVELLNKYDAPKKIDYLSIDTEGTELQILKAFDFKKYTISIITCEHNFSEKRELIRELLESNGFKRVLETHSQFDDWYISKSLFDNSRFNPKWTDRAIPKSDTHKEFKK